MREHHRLSSKQSCREVGHIIQCDVGSLADMRRHYSHIAALQTAVFPTLLPVRREWQEKRPKVAPAPFKPLAGYKIPTRTIQNRREAEPSNNRIAQVRLEPIQPSRPTKDKQKTAFTKIRETAQELQTRIAAMEMGVSDMKRTYNRLMDQLKDYEDQQ